MSERTYYVMCNDNCRFESMTKEQILTAITQAVETGTIGDINTGFVTTVKDINEQIGLQFWFGTEGQFNLLSPQPETTECVARVTTDGKIYLCSDDSYLGDMERRILAQVQSSAGTSTTPNGTVLSGNADNAEVGEWTDGNPDAENRIGYFVCIDTENTESLTMVKANAVSDVRGVTVSAPAFAANASPDKYNSTGELLPQYSYVAWAGIVTIIDNGLCTVGARCMPADDGTAIPSTNNLGYQVVKRENANHIKIIVEPNADMIQRVKTDVITKQRQHTTGTITIETEDWDSNKRCVKACDGINTTDTIIVSPAPVCHWDYSSSGTHCTAQGDNTLSFSCDALPDDTLTVNVLVLGVSE